MPEDLAIFIDWENIYISTVTEYNSKPNVSAMEAVAPRTLAPTAPTESMFTWQTQRRWSSCQNASAYQAEPA